jgi:glycerol-3-phosphate dehydrogenase
VKGSHLVVDRLFEHDHCYIFQNADGRICFAIPYEYDYTLIGTTDEDFHGPLGGAVIADGETDYLLNSVSAYLQKPVTRAQIRWSYSGIRSLYDDGASKAQEATRDYVLKLDTVQGQAPLLSVFGGKITTFRKLAEAVLLELRPFLPGMGPPWTAGAKLPGGDVSHDGISREVARLQNKYSFLKPRNALRLFRAYGSEVDEILGEARFAADLGRWFGPLSERELAHLRRKEWAETAEDVLWRRSKLGLHMSTAEKEALQAFMEGGGEARAPLPAPRRAAKRRKA